MPMDVIDYEMFGDDMQYVEIELDPGEAVIGEAGAMMMMQDGIEMDTAFGDGSKSSATSGLMGKLLGAGLSLLLALVIGDPSATLTGQAADRLLNLKFSRDAEREADERGFSLLLARGIDPHGMVAFFATLAKQHGAALPALLSSHPASAEREAALAARLEKMPADCCKPLVIDGVWPSL